MDATRGSVRHRPAVQQLALLRGQTCPDRLQSVGRIVALALRAAPPLAGETSLDECRRRLLHAIIGLLVGEPLRQLRHPVVEDDSGLVAEFLPSERDVGEAMPDVAGTVLLPQLRLDIHTELAREHLGDAQHRRRVACSEVDGAEIASARLESSLDAGRDVCDVHEVTALAAVLEDDGRPAVQEA